MAEIKIKLKCNSIGPLDNLEKEFQSKSLKIGVYANNGSGKTFVSRMFRLLEKPSSIESDEGISAENINRLITLGKTNAAFGFAVYDGAGAEVENISINLSSSRTPSIPITHYLYHTFNQDYVDENIRRLDYVHDQDVQGFILGKVNIDLTEDNRRLSEITKEWNDLRDKITTAIDNFVSNNISSIRDIKRITEFKQFVSAEAFLMHGVDLQQMLGKTFNEYIADFDKVKSVPETLLDINPIQEFSIDQKLIEEIIIILITSYNLSHFADEFKAEMKIKQEFIEKGVALMEKDDDYCPFCKQMLELDAYILISQYNEFLSGEESKIVKQIQSLIQAIEGKRKELLSIKSKNSEAMIAFNEYKTKFIPSCENESLTAIELTPVEDSLIALQSALKRKLTAISTVVPIAEIGGVELLEERVNAFNKSIVSNNGLIDEINKKKNAIGEESKEIRRNICKAVYNHWIEKYGEDQKKYLKLGQDAAILKKEIEKKQSSQRIEKKRLVADTIKQVLDYFFSGKYKLDENTFRLVFQSKTLEKDQTKNVLSEGEKNIIAFAYYLGDTHAIIEKDDDYKRLFFIIDDPISSMDFTYVYTLSGVIRELKNVFPKMGDRTRCLVLTHNNDFIRILSSNNIVDKVMLLKNGELQDWNDNFTVPYIHHLHDIYRVARKGERASHTTANSIRHIIETIDRFERINTNEDSVKEFIKNHIDSDKKVYTYINDLSHGGWRSEQPPMTDEDYREMCEVIVKMVESKYPDQIRYCEERN